jgi:general secretion pathway protein L
MTPATQLIERLRIEHVAPARRALIAAWSWWTAELSRMLPAGLQELLGRSGRKVLLSPKADELAAHEKFGDQTAEIARIRLDAAADQQVSPTVLARLDGGVIVLPPGKSLVKRITLPAATEENLRGVLEFEMDRETPFPAEKVYFDAQVAARSNTDKTIDVDLVLTPRTYLDDLVARLSRSGVTASAATARNRHGELVEANLLPLDLRKPQARLADSLNVRLAALACLLLVTAIALPIFDKVSAIAELAPRVEAAKVAAQDGSRIRDNIERLHTAAQSLVDRKSTEPMILELLDATTRIVPDDTWITEFEVDGQRVRINGESSVAASLIELFDRSPGFGKPEFGAPVTKVRNTERERFDLSIEWLEGDGS